MVKPWSGCHRNGLVAVLTVKVHIEQAALCMFEFYSIPVETVRPREILAAEIDYFVSIVANYALYLT